MNVNTCFCFSFILFVWDLTGYTELCVQLSVTMLHVKKGLLSKFVTNFSERIIQIIKFSMVSSLPFWRLLHDTNIITNAGLNSPHNIIIQFGEDCSWFIIPYVIPNSIFQRFHHIKSCSLQPKLMYLYTHWCQLPQQPVLLLSSWAYWEEGPVCKELLTHLVETMQLNLKNADRIKLYPTVFRINEIVLHSF